MYVWDVEFRVLGPLVVLGDDGSDVLLGGPKERSVLALLLTASGEVVDTDRLVEELWPESRPDSGRKTVQAYVSRLRGRFVEAGNDQVIDALATGYVFRPEDHSVDSHSFESVLVEARHMFPSEPEQAAESIREGLDLWRGRPFEDAHPTPGLDLEAARLEELRLSALEAWGEAELAVGRHRELIPELRRLTAEHPFREGYWGLLMLALYRSGRQSEALSAYKEVGRLLGEELGLEPGKDLTDLEERILVGDSSLEALRRIDGSVRNSIWDRLNWRILSGVGVLVMLLMLVVGLRWSGGEPVTEVTVEGRYPFPEGGTQVVAADAKVWILNPQSSAVSVFDPVTESFATHDLPFAPSALAAGMGYVWVVSAESGAIAKIDPSTRAVISDVDGYDLEGASVAVGDGAVWIVREHSTPFLKVDPSTLAVETLAWSQLPGSVDQPDLDVHEGIVWGSNAFLGRIMSLDPDAGSVELAGDPRIGEHSARGVLANRGAIWVGQPTNGTVTRIDAETREVTAIAQVGRSSGSGFGRIVPPYGLAAGPGGVWVASPRDGRVVLLDDETAAVIAKLDFQRPTAIIATAETVWVLDDGTDELVELAPASCSPTPFIGAGADLRGCDLSGKSLAGVDLTGADLRWADLQLTGMQTADLTNADLYGADLSSASVDGAVWSGTHCPDGTLSDDNGDTCLGHLHP